MSGEIKGIEELQHKLSSLGPNAVKQGGAALYQEALLIKIEAVHRCPKDTGNLRDSHDVTKPAIDGEGVSVSIVCGGPAAPYALAVHENLNPGVHWSLDGTGPKWLENTVREASATLAERIVKRIDMNAAARG